MATVGLAHQSYIHQLLLPHLIGSNLTPQMSAHRTAHGIVTTVSPSAVWYTSSIDAKPQFQLYFVRSGYVRVTYGSLRSLSLDSYTRSASSATYSSATDANTYDFHFNASIVYPSLFPNNRYSAFPVRCLVHYVKQKNNQYAKFPPNSLYPFIIIHPTKSPPSPRSILPL